MSETQTRVAPTESVECSSMFVDGKPVGALSQRTLEVKSPETGRVIARIPRSDVAEVDLAVQAARRSINGEWGAMSALERGRLLTKLGEMTLARIDELAEIEALDTGKPLALAKNDITALARYFEFYGGAADKVHGEVIPYLSGYAVSVLKERAGVVAHIIPWNYPAQMLGRTVAPALTMGNACVVKPAEEACLTSLRFAELAARCGLPAGALNVVTGLGFEAGAALSSHTDINMITFTGSPAVGSQIQSAAAQNHVKCVLELGGKSPQVVFDDADLDRAIPAILNGIVQNAGQTCSAGSRVLVQKKISSNVSQRLADGFSTMTAGPSNSNPTCGPIITRKQYELVRKCIDDAKHRGVPVIGEGTLDSNCSANGNYVAPICFGPVAADDSLATEEIFGPVLSFAEFDTEDDAVELANATPYGLVAGVWTQNGARQQRVSRRLLCGQVFVNCFGAGGGVERPFGGVKKSGHGREKGLQALDEFCVTKTVVNYFE